MCDSGPILPKPGYLEGVREVTRKYGVLLIFDEVITGFRLALGGAQAYYGVTPICPPCQGHRQRLPLWRRGGPAGGHGLRGPRLGDLQWESHRGGRGAGHH